MDEQDSFRRQMRDILHGIGGFQVVAETTSCRMALETVMRVKIDLVISNFTLGDTDGIELITRLKQLSTSPHIIIFAPTMSDSALLQAIMAGADGYLVKDTPTRDIIRAFKNFERGGPAMRPSVTAHGIHLLVERCKSVEVHLANGLAQHDLVADSLLVSHTSRNGMPSSPLMPDIGAPSANELTILPRLSPQEEKVFLLLRQGQRNKQIAAHLAISPYTVGKHVQNILRKLGVVNRTQAAAYTSFEG